MSNIVRQASAIRLTIPALSMQSKSARIFLSRIQTEEAFQANPGCKISATVSLEAPEAILNVKYKDGKTLELATSKLGINDVLHTFGKHAKKLQDAEDAMN